MANDPPIMGASETINMGRFDTNLSETSQNIKDLRKMTMYNKNQFGPSTKISDVLAWVNTKKDN